MKKKAVDVSVEGVSAGSPFVSLSIVRTSLLALAWRGKGAVFVCFQFPKVGTLSFSWRKDSPYNVICRPSLVEKTLRESSPTTFTGWLMGGSATADEPTPYTHSPSLSSLPFSAVSLSLRFVVEPHSYLRPWVARN